VLDEIDIWSEKDISLDLIKKLLEGTEFTVARKNRDPAVVQPIHTFISTNTKPPEAVDEKGNRSYHIEAVLSRIQLYETRELDSTDESIARTVAKDEAAAWAILCTQKHPYIVVPPDYFPSE
jgi:DNA-binding transcriptional MerR regulator